MRLHSECLTGDTFGSQRCDCGPQLALALQRVAAEGGAVVYLRGHEGRGVGLLNKLQAYALQDQGFDTVDAQTELGLPIDAREYAAGAAILIDLGINSVRLLTNNPLKVDALGKNQITVAMVEPISIGRSRPMRAICAPSAAGWATTCSSTPTPASAGELRAPNSTPTRSSP